MRLNFGELFQEGSKDKNMGGLVNIPQDKSLWPPEWTQTQYKTYERFTSIPLPQPIPRTFGHTYLIQRRSTNTFIQRTEDGIPSRVTLQQLSNVLFYSCGEVSKDIFTGKIHRAQASAGGRYPIETYILNFEAGDLGCKCYHYNVKNHSLEQLWDIQESPRTFFGSSGTTAALGIVLTGIMPRISMKYGERGYKYAYLEAGAILGNIEHNSIHEGIQSIIMGGTNERAIEELLDIDGIHETVIMGILLG